MPKLILVGGAIADYLGWVALLGSIAWAAAPGILGVFPFGIAHARMPRGA